MVELTKYIMGIKFTSYDFRPICDGFDGFPGKQLVNLIFEITKLSVFRVNRRPNEIFS